MNKGIDYNKDAFQGNNHYGISSGSSSVDQYHEILKTDRTFYSVSRNPELAISDSITKCKCLYCGESDIKGEYKYCPNCGKKFTTT